MARYADKPAEPDGLRQLELMDRFGLTTAFSFDRDFRDCGYQMLP